MVCHRRAEWRVTLIKPITECAAERAHMLVHEHPHDWPLTLPVLAVFNPPLLLPRSQCLAVRLFSFYLPVISPSVFL